MTDKINNIVRPGQQPKTSATARFTQRKLQWLEHIAGDSSVSHLCFRVAFILSTYLNRLTGEAFPSQRTLANRLGVTVRAVQKAVNRLVQANYLRVTKQRGRGHTNTYAPIVDDRSLITHTIANGGSAFEKKNTNGEGNKREPWFLKTRTAVRTEPFEEPFEEPFDEQSSRSTSVSTLDEQESDECFDEFWSHYPRKVEKKGARVIFDRILKKGEATPDQLLAGVRAYSRVCNSRDPKYIKHPTTWLNNGCWADESPAEVASNTASVNWEDHVARFCNDGSWLAALAGR